MIRWTPLMAAGLLALLSACSSSKTVPALNAAGGTANTADVATIMASPNTDSTLVSASSIKLDILDNATDQGYVGDKATFLVTTPAAEPWVEVKCYQDAKLVYSEMRSFFSENKEDRIFTLGPTASWTNGSVGCGAELVIKNKRKLTMLARTAFIVSGK